MMFKAATSVAVLSLAFGLAPPALSQTSTPQRTPGTEQQAAPKAPIAGQIQTQDDNTILAKDLIGHTVNAPDNTKLGTISDLILSKDAKNVEGFVIGLGGFLGIGEKAVAFKMDRLQLTSSAEGGVRLAMDVKKEELQNAPEFKAKKDLEKEKQAKQSSPQQRPGGQKKSGGPGGL